MVEPQQPHQRNSGNLSSSGLTMAWVTIGNKWKMEILWALRNGRCRFSALRKRIPQISDRMLSQSLRELEQNELVIREIFAEIPPRVEYQLTTNGETVIPILQRINAWGIKRMVTKLDSETPKLDEPEWI